MNRSEFVAAVANRADSSPPDVEKVLAAMLDEIAGVVAGDAKLTIPGYLTFERAARSARTGRNPQTGEPVDIAATHVAKVTIGSRLKAAAKG